MGCPFGYVILIPDALNSVALFDDIGLISMVWVKGWTTFPKVLDDLGYRDMFFFCFLIQLYLCMSKV